MGNPLNCTGLVARANMAEEEIDECYSAPKDPPFHFHIVGDGGCAAADEEYPEKMQPENQIATDLASCAKKCFETQGCRFFDWGWPDYRLKTDSGSEENWSANHCNLFTASTEIVKGNNYAGVSCYKLQKVKQ